MELVSTLNLASSENEKIIRACNFQTMAMNSAVMPHDLIKGRIGNFSYMANMKLFVVS